MHVGTSTRVGHSSCGNTATNARDAQIPNNKRVDVEDPYREIVVVNHVLTTYSAKDSRRRTVLHYFFAYHLQVGHAAVLGQVAGGRSPLLFGVNRLLLHFSSGIPVLVFYDNVPIHSNQQKYKIAGGTSIAAVYDM